MASLQISLKPSPAFCIKSAALEPGVFNAYASPQHPRPVAVPKGLKVFVNIAWDKNVPPPPEGSEEAIQRAMQGQEVDGLHPGDWFVPVIVSGGREDKDKAGKSALVFDCVFNSSLKGRTLKDPAFKTFLIELALQRIEAESSLLLSRTLGTPNIPSKGALQPRTVSVPTALFLPSHPLRQAASAAPAKKLIEEIHSSPSTLPPPPAPAASAPPKKGILKNTARGNAGALPDAAGPTTAPDAGTRAAQDLALETPEWSWTPRDDGRLCIAIRVPKLTHADVPRAELELEPRALHLHVPALYALDVDLDLPDAALPPSPPATRAALELKRARDLDVDGARAEWRVAEGRLLLFA